MKKIIRNHSLPPIKMNINSSPNKVKSLKIIKTTNTNNDHKVKRQYNTKRVIDLLIYIRCRPLSNLEKQLSSNETLIIKENNNMNLIDPIEVNNKSRKIFNYKFDYIFDQNINQKIFYETGIKNLIDGIFEGINTCIFTYGAHNSGKTYTMLGTDSTQGIMSFTLEEIFSRINIIKDREYKLKFSFYEIHNGNIIDLLNFKKEKKENMELIQDKEKGIKINDLTEIKVDNNTEIIKILRKGSRNINKEMAKIKETKSFSYVILQIILEYKKDSKIKYNNLYLIDSTGCCSLNNETKTNNINILTIDKILTYLNEPNRNKEKLALNKDINLFSLINNSPGDKLKIVLIGNISPAISCFEDTYNTLKNLDKMKNALNKKNNVVEENLQKKEGEINLNKNSNNSKENFNKNKKNQRNRNTANIITNSNTFYYSENIQQGENLKTYVDYPSIINKEVNNNENTSKPKDESDFNSIVFDLRRICDEQVNIKQKIISIQKELSRMHDNNDNHLKKDLIAYMNEYKEYSSKINRIYNETINNNISEIQKYMLNLIMKNSSHKIQMLDNKYYNILNMRKIDIQEEYISQLEKQIQLRDELFLKNGININRIFCPNLKEFKILKDDYMLKTQMNLGITPRFKEMMESSNNKDNINNDFGNSKIKRFNLNKQINHKIKEFNLKKISNDNSIYNNIRIQKERNILNAFKQNSNIINKKLISYRKRNDLKEQNNFSGLEIGKSNTSNIDLMNQTNEITFDYDNLSQNKKIQINKNLLDKAFGKRNIKRKILLDKINAANKSIN